MIVAAWIMLIFSGVICGLFWLVFLLGLIILLMGGKVSMKDTSIIKMLILHLVFATSAGVIWGGLFQ